MKMWNNSVVNIDASCLRQHSPAIFTLLIIIFALSALFLFPHMVASELVEIQLPELTGIYTEDTLSRTSTIDLGQPVAEVHQLWIRWTGKVIFGVGQGDGFLYPPEELFPWPCLVYASMETPEFALLNAHVDPGEGIFQDTTVFQGSLEPGSGFLSDGTGEVTAGILPANVPGGIMISSPIVEFDSVSIILDIDFVTSVENTSTWGEIKSRYRRNSASP
jgi:hypothetical protein